jgi:hypothetical protein
MRRVIFLGLLALGACGTTESGPETEKSGEKPADSAIALVEEPVKDSVVTDTAMVLAEVPANARIEDRAALFFEGIGAQYTLSDPEGKSHLLDRFAARWKFKGSFSWEFDAAYGTVFVTPVAHISIYAFSDSASLANVLGNWWNCFESDCNTVEPGKPTGSLKTPPAFAIINPNDFEVIYLHYLCEHESGNWAQLKRLMVMAFARKGWYGFDLKCGKAAIWSGRVPG